MFLFIHVLVLLGTGACAGAAKLMTVLRGRGNYFRPGNADVQQDELLRGHESAPLAVPVWRATADEAEAKFDQLYGMGLHRLMSTVKDSDASHTMKIIIIKPCAGKRRARFERGK